VREGITIKIAAFVSARAITQRNRHICTAPSSEKHRQMLELCKATDERTGKQEAASPHIFKKEHRKAVWKVLPRPVLHVFVCMRPLCHSFLALRLLPPHATVTQQLAAAEDASGCDRGLLVPCPSRMLRFEAASALAINPNTQRQHQRCSVFSTRHLAHNHWSKNKFNHVFSL
jgi:hypothetical protein